MGKNQSIKDLDTIKKSEISGFVAEVFYEQLLFVLGDQSNKEIWVQNHGMNSRAFSKDVIDLSSYTYATDNLIKQAVFIHLGRNSFYHHLPEFFFHPLVISNPTMTNKDVVEEIRKNKKVEQGNIRFFIPFDTELFLERLKLSNRYLSLFTTKSGKKILMRLASKLIAKEMSLTKEQYYKLFMYMGKSENFKESLPKLEELLWNILGYPVQLNYQKKTHLNSPLENLGDGILGKNFGTQGPVKSEFSDVSATMMPNKDMLYKRIKQEMRTIRGILEFFVFSNREIHLKYQCSFRNELRLGENYLGYDTILGEAQNKMLNT